MPHSTAGIVKGDFPEVQKKYWQWMSRSPSGQTRRLPYARGVHYLSSIVSSIPVRSGKHKQQGVIDALAVPVDCSVRRSIDSATKLNGDLIRIQDI